MEHDWLYTEARGVVQETWYCRRCRTIRFKEPKTPDELVLVTVDGKWKNLNCEEKAVFLVQEG